MRPFWRKKPQPKALCVPGNNERHVLAAARRKHRLAERLGGPRSAASGVCVVYSAEGLTEYDGLWGTTSRAEAPPEIVRMARQGVTQRFGRVRADRPWADLQSARVTAD